MKSFLLGLSLSVAFIIGCVVGTIPQSQSRAPGIRPGTNPPRWEYYCFQPGTGSKLTVTANRVGDLGWEMVSGIGGGSDVGNSVWCFKRRLPPARR